MSCWMHTLLKDMWNIAYYISIFNFSNLFQVSLFLICIHHVDGQEMRNAAILQSEFIFHDLICIGVSENTNCLIFIIWNDKIVYFFYSRRMYIETLHVQSIMKLTL